MSTVPTFTELGLYVVHEYQMFVRSSCDSTGICHLEYSMQVEPILYAVQNYIWVQIAVVTVTLHIIMMLGIMYYIHFSGFHTQVYSACQQIIHSKAFNYVKQFS